MSSRPGASERPQQPLAGKLTGKLSRTWSGFSFDLRLLLAAQFVSVLGTQVSTFALPTLAVLRFGADAQETALLLVAEALPAAMLGPVLGAVVDRLTTRKVLILADVVRAVVLATVPLSAALGVLSLSQLFLVAGIVGLATVPFTAALGATVPRITSACQLTSANAAIGGTQAAGSIGGPALAGALVGAFGAATAVLADVASYVISATVLIRLRSPAVRATPTRTARTSILSDVQAGIGIVRSNSILLRSLTGAGLLNLGGAGIGALFFLYSYRTLHLSPLLLSLSLVAFSLGAIVGASIVGPVSLKYGQGRTCLGCSLLASASLFLIPLASFGLPMLGLTAYELIFGACATGWVVILATIRQEVTADVYRGRVTAVAMAVSTVALPVGAGLAAGLNAAFGLVDAILILCAITAAAPVAYAKREFRDFDPLAGSPTVASAPRRGG